MPGFDVNRFIGLEDWLAIELKCSICLNVFDKAVDTHCGHTFCKECIQQSLLKGLKDCPECRQPLNTKKRNNNYESIFKNIRRIDGIISKLQTKCDFESNGCKKIMDLSSLTRHLEECDFNVCETCGLRVGRKSEHNCIELLKNGMNEYKRKYTESDTKCKTLEQEIKRLKRDNGLDASDDNTSQTLNQTIEQKMDTKSDENNETSDYEEDDAEISSSETIVSDNEFDSNDPSFSDQFALVARPCPARFKPWAQKKTEAVANQ